jgi:hypothetical protein
MESGARIQKGKHDTGFCFHWEGERKGRKKNVGAGALNFNEGKKRFRCVGEKGKNETLNSTGKKGFDGLGKRGKARN